MIEQGKRVAALTVDVECTAEKRMRRQ